MKTSEEEQKKKSEKSGRNTNPNRNPCSKHKREAETHARNTNLARNPCPKHKPETQTQPKTQPEIHAETQAQTLKIEKRGRDGSVWVSFGLGTWGFGFMAVGLGGDGSAA